MLTAFENAILFGLSLQTVYRLAAGDPKISGNAIDLCLSIRTVAITRRLLSLIYLIEGWYIAKLAAAIAFNCMTWAIAIVGYYSLAWKQPWLQNLYLVMDLVPIWICGWILQNAVQNGAFLTALIALVVGVNAAVVYTRVRAFDVIAGLDSRLKRTKKPY